MKKVLSNYWIKQLSKGRFYPRMEHQAKPLWFITAVVLFTILTLALPAIAEDVQLPPQERHAELGKAVTSNGICKMTEEQFEKFARERARFHDMSWFRSPNRLAKATQEEIKIKLVLRQLLILG